MFMRIAAIACAACFGICQAGVIYDFNTIHEGTILPITFPDGTVIDSPTNNAFHIVNFGGVGHLLRDEPPYMENHSIRIRFPQTYTAISLDFLLNSLTVDPWLTMYVVGAGSQSSQGAFPPTGMFPQGKLAFEGAPFDTVFLVACESLDSTGGCNFPGEFRPPVGFAIYNLSVSDVPEPAPAALTALGFGVLWLAARRKR